MKLFWRTNFSKASSSVMELINFINRNLPIRVHIFFSNFFKNQIFWSRNCLISIFIYCFNVFWWIWSQNIWVQIFLNLSKVLPNILKIKNGLKHYSWINKIRMKRTSKKRATLKNFSMNCGIWKYNFFLLNIFKYQTFLLRNLKKKH